MVKLEETIGIRKIEWLMVEVTQWDVWLMVRQLGSANLKSKTNLHAEWAVGNRNCGYTR